MTEWIPEPGPPWEPPVIGIGPYLDSGELPDGAYATFDLRVNQHAGGGGTGKPGLDPEGFFFFPPGTPLPAHLDAVTFDLPGGEAGRLQRRLGLSTRPTDVKDAIWLAGTVDAVDYLGQDSVTPYRGNIVIPGLGVIPPVGPLATHASRSGELQLIRHLAATAGDQGKYLTWLSGKHRLSIEDTQTLFKLEGVEPKTLQTSNYDTFDTSGGDLNWSALDQSVWTLGSGVADHDGSTDASDGSARVHRCDDGFSADDVSAQIVESAFTPGQIGVALRIPASPSTTATYYLYLHSNSASLSVGKFVSGTYTQLWADTSFVTSGGPQRDTGWRVRGWARDSTIGVIHTNAAAGSLTTERNRRWVRTTSDSAITGNNYAGLYGYSNTNVKASSYEQNDGYYNVVNDGDTEFTAVSLSTGSNSANYESDVDFDYGGQTGSGTWDMGTPVAGRYRISMFYNISDNRSVATEWEVEVGGVDEPKVYINQEKDSSVSVSSSPLRIYDNTNTNYKDFAAVIWEGELNGSQSFKLKGDVSDNPETGTSAYQIFDAIFVEFRGTDEKDANVYSVFSEECTQLISSTDSTFGYGPQLPFLDGASFATSEGALDTDSTDGDYAQWDLGVKNSPCWIQWKEGSNRCQDTPVKLQDNGAVDSTTDFDQRCPPDRQYWYADSWWHKVGSLNAATDYEVRIDIAGTTAGQYVVAGNILLDAGPAMSDNGGSITVEATATAQGNANSVTSGNVDTTGADCLLLWVGGDSTLSNTPTDNQSNTWTLNGSSTGTSTGGRLYYCMNPTTSATHTFSHSETGKDPSLVIIALSGVDTDQTPTDVGVNDRAITANNVYGPSTSEQALTTKNSFVGSFHAKNFSNSASGYTTGLTKLQVEPDANSVGVGVLYRTYDNADNTFPTHYYTVTGRQCERSIILTPAEVVAGSVGRRLLTGAKLERMRLV